MKKSILVLPILLLLLTGCADKETLEDSLTLTAAEVNTEVDEKGVVDNTGANGYVLVEKERAPHLPIWTESDTEEVLYDTEYEEPDAFEDFEAKEDEESYEEEYEETSENFVEDIFYEEPEESVFYSETVNYGSEYELMLRDTLPNSYYDFMSFDIFSTAGEGKSFEYANDAFKYYTAYMHYGQPSETWMDANVDSAGFIKTMQYNVEPYDMRKDLTSQIAVTYGVFAEPDVTDTLFHTHERIHAMLVYDMNYTFEPMGKCIQDGRGVCWTYAQIARTLLNLEGIPCSLVIGTYQGEGHAFNKAYVNGEWIYLDFTFGKTPFIDDFSKYQVTTEL